MTTGGSEDAREVANLAPSRPHSYTDIKRHLRVIQRHINDLYHLIEYLEETEQNSG